MAKFIENFAMRNILIFTILYLSTGIALADIQVAQDALARGQYQEAAIEFEKLAQQGNVYAQAQLGYMYYIGQGVEKNYTKAFEWHTRAATLGNRDSQYNLAIAYTFGEGTEQDHSAAFQWYRRAATQGHATAQYSLGMSYLYGEGIDQDIVVATEWVKKSAQQGYVRAQVLLGSFYHTGEGLEKNYEQAASWYRKAAEKNDVVAQYNLGILYRTGQGVPQDYEQAIKWLRLAANQGYIAAQNTLSDIENTSTKRDTVHPTQPLLTDTKQQISTDSEDSPASIVTTKTSINQTQEQTDLPSITETTTASPAESTQVTAQTSNAEQPKKGFFAKLFEKRTAPKIPDQDTETIYVTHERYDPSYATHETIDQVQEQTDPSAISEQTAASPEEIAQTQEQTDPSAISEQTTASPEENTQVAAQTTNVEKSKKGFFAKLFEKRTAAEIPDQDTETIYVTHEKSDPSYATEIAISKESSSLATTNDRTTPLIMAARDEQIAIRPAIPEEIAKTENSPSTITEQTDINYATPEEIAKTKEQNKLSTITETDTSYTSPEEIAQIQEEIDLSSIAEQTTPSPAENTQVAAQTSNVEQPKKGFFAKLFEKRTAATDQDTETIYVTHEKSDPSHATEIAISKESSNLATTNDRTAPLIMAARDEHIAINHTSLEKMAKTEEQNKLSTINEQTDINYATPAEIAEKKEQNRLSTINEQTDINYVSLEETAKTEEQNKLSTINEQTDTNYTSTEEIAKAKEQKSLPTITDGTTSLVMAARGENTRVLAQQPKQNVFSRLFGKKTEPELVEEHIAISYATAEETEQNQKTSAGKRADAEMLNRDTGSDTITQQKTDTNYANPEEIVVKNIKLSPINTTNAAIESTAINTAEDSVHNQETNIQNDLAHLHSLAERNDVLAQLRLAHLYYSGQQIAQNNTQAFRWYRRAAQQGNAEAQYNLANMYLLGEGIEINNIQAKKWYEKAAKQGHENAQHNFDSLEKLAPKNQSATQNPAAQNIANKQQQSENIQNNETASSIYKKGLNYEFGTGVIQNHQTALKFFRQAAAENHLAAQYKLGIAYAYGQGITKNSLEAIKWYEKAATRGYALAQRALATLYMTGAEENIRSNKPLSLAWYNILAEKGNILDIQKRDTLKGTLSQAEITQATVLQQQLLK